MEIESPTIKANKLAVGLVLKPSGRSSATIISNESAQKNYF